MQHYMPDSMKQDQTLRTEGKVAAKQWLGLALQGSLDIYPSYQENQGWVFPGIGDFQVRPISYVL